MRRSQGLRRSGRCGARGDVPHPSWLEVSKTCKALRLAGFKQRGLAETLQTVGEALDIALRESSVASSAAAQAAFSLGERGAMNARTVAIAGVELVVREWGDPEGRPLVFWHALNPFGALVLNEAGPAWAQRGFRVLAPAAPGGGESSALADPDAYRPTRLADLVAGLAAALEVERFAFVGWSWGASIGVHLAVAHPALLDALVLLDAGHTDVGLARSRDELEREFVAEQEGYAFESWDAFLAAVRARVRSWRPQLEERFRAGMVERDGRIVARADARAAAWALHGVAIEPPSGTHTRLAPLELPILLIRSEEADDAEPLARFTAALPSAEVLSIPGGHDLLADAPKETIAIVADWLASHQRDKTRERDATSSCDRANLPSRGAHRSREGNQPRE